MGIELGLAYLTLGVFVGFFAGLLGIGGGGIMVPVLVTLFLWQDFPDKQVVHYALGSSMAAIVPISLVSMFVHHKKGAVLWPVIRYMIPSVMIATFTMSFWVAAVPSSVLAIFFCGFMTVVAWTIWSGRYQLNTRKMPSQPSLVLAGGVIGSISAWVAIGGGSLTVPFFLRYGISIRQAIASSAAVGFPLSMAGVLGYAMVDLEGIVDQMPATLGFVYIPAVVIITLASVVTVPFGVSLSHRIPVKILKRIFSVLLILLSFKMLWSIL